MKQCQRHHLRYHLRHRNRHRNDPAWLTLILLALAIAGCAAHDDRRAGHAANGSPANGQSAAVDGCEWRLQDLAGGLLTYYALHNQLPPNLKALDLPAGDPAATLSCPVSHQPYIYDPRGIPAPDGNSRLVIYDAVAAHGKFRWAVSIAERQGGQPLVAEVIAVPEATFVLAGLR